MSSKGSTRSSADSASPSGKRSMNETARPADAVPPRRGLHCRSITSAHADRGYHFGPPCNRGDGPILAVHGSHTGGLECPDSLSLRRR